MAAPPAPDPLPEKVERRISMRPEGGAVAIGPALAKRQVEERHVARGRMDLEKPVESHRLHDVLERGATIHDRGLGVLTIDGDRAHDVDVTRLGKVVVDDW